GAQHAGGHGRGRARGSCGGGRRARGLLPRGAAGGGGRAGGGPRHPRHRRARVHDPMSPAPTVELSHPDKVLWPQPGFTKADLAAYYAAVADRLLPHLRGRPLTLKRYNAGVDGEGFFQKNLPESAPAWLERFTTWTPSSNRDVTYLVVRSAADLQWLANQNAIELHP